MDRSCHSSGGSTTISTTTGSTSSSNVDNINNRDHYLKHLNKLSHKISKPSTANAPPIIKKSSFDHTQALPPPQLQQSHPSQPQPQNPNQSSLQAQQNQPPVYNINKNDFRDVVQKLTGSPAHERYSTSPPPIHQPKPQSSRLQRIRPPPLAHVSNRPMGPMINYAVPNMNPPGCSLPTLPISGPIAILGIPTIVLTHLTPSEQLNRPSTTAATTFVVETATSTTTAAGTIKGDTPVTVTAIITTVWVPELSAVTVSFTFPKFAIFYEFESIRILAVADGTSSEPKMARPLINSKFSGTTAGSSGTYMSISMGQKESAHLCFIIIPYCLRSDFFIMKMDDNNNWLWRGLNSPTEGTDDRPLPAMADAQTEKPLSLSEQYALQEKEEKSDVTTKPAEAKEVENPVNAATGSGDVVTEKLEETSADPVEGSTKAPPPAAEESTEANPATGNNGEDAAEENLGDSEETPEIKLETAPADFRFPTTNQTRHCFTRYIEYHRCVAAKGEGAPECDKFAKYYRALCPGEWIDRWNEQRENGTFPGPL
ncbi:hypothetical protein J1N35_030359 [Gossypium stocksii]|uniref:VQ domain-containing protein n=1 Tax=Gossypium stocksii TaxID=47602 RepID=A0A9D3UZP1_9ROSI|nr:hypothetical protein J1N35_030359 [Gossypium stocksii]